MWKRLDQLSVLLTALSGAAYGQPANNDTWYFLKDGVCLAPGDARLNMDEFGIYNTRLLKTPADVAILLRKAGIDERIDPDNTSIIPSSPHFA